jgi:drug/metabolite transporter (DMT)-like permease
MDVCMLAGLLLALAGSIALYLASPHQRWRAQPLPARPAGLMAALLLAGATLLLSHTLLVVTAVFVLLTWLMLLCVALTYLGALRPEPRKH